MFITISVNLFAGNIKAMKNVWCIRDRFLYDVFTSFPALCQLAKVEKKEPPFLHAYYNVNFFFEHPLSEVKYLETRIYNSFVEGLNNNEKLPKYILIILDKDMIEAIKNLDFGIKLSMERAVCWLIEHLDQAIYWRKGDIHSKKPGALTGAGEPRLIFTSVLQCPRNTECRKHKVFRLVRKVNAVLESVILKHSRYCHMMYLESVNEFIHYDYQGNLMSQGRTQFWKEIDKQMKQFDKCQIDLKPKSYATHRQWDHKNIHQHQNSY